jgi:hypothetical protein
MTVENPKAGMGRQKINFSTVPAVSQLYIAAAMDFGAIKYGWHNWRTIAIDEHVYTAALERHLNAIKAGEYIDPESGLPHWAHIAAGCCIVMDAENAEKLNRPLKAPVNDYPKIVAHLADLKRGWVEAQAAREAA